MRALLVKLTAGFMLIGCVLGGAAGQQPAGKHHIILLDTSGSMVRRYSPNNLKGWLIEPLLQSSAFGPNDQVIVWEFNERPAVTFSQDDQDRHYRDKFDRNRVLAKIPTQAHRAKNTDLPQALDLALADIRGFQLSGDVLIWLVTDNAQDTATLKSPVPLYEKITADKNFQAAYIFPLLLENGAPVPNDQDAMVMYLLHYSQQKPFSGLDRIAEDVGKQIKNDPITWFPLESRIVLDQAGTTVNSEPASYLDNRLVLPPVVEGAALDFDIRFRFRSQIKGQDSVHGKIINQMALVEIPGTLRSEGDANSWRAVVSPSTLNIQSSQKTTGAYSARLSATDARLYPAGFWNAVWNSTGDPVNLTLQFALADVEVTPKLNTAPLQKVKNLEEIKNTVKKSQKTGRVVQIPMSFEVTYNSMWRRVVVGLVAFGLLGVLAAAIIVSQVRSRYELSTPQGERLVALPLIGKSYVTAPNGDRAAVISKRFGKLSVAPTGGFLLNGGLGSQALSEQSNSFEIQGQTEGNTQRYRYSIHRASGSNSQPVKRDEFFD